MKRILTEFSHIFGVPVLAVLVGVASPARAEPPPSTAVQNESPGAANKEEARTRFSRGVDLFREGDFAAALVEFRRAYEAVPNFNVLYNIGQACIELQDHASALKALEKYLDEGGSEIAPARRAQVLLDVERLRARIGYLRIRVPAPNADIAIDDVVVGRSPMDGEFVVNAGRRKVTVNGGQIASLNRLVDVAVAEHSVFALEETPAAPVAAPVAKEPGPAADASTSGGSSSNAPLWIGLVSTGVLATGTVVSGIVALSAKSTLDDRVATYPTTHREVEDAREKAATWVTVTDILGAATVVAGGVTAYLAISRKSASRTRTTAFAVGPGSVVLSGGF